MYVLYANWTDCVVIFQLIVAPIHHNTAGTLKRLWKSFGFLARLRQMLLAPE